MATIGPIPRDDGMIYFGKHGLNIKRIYGIEPDNYLKMHEQIKKQGLKIRYLDARAQTTFLLYCYALHEMGADVTILIREFNSAQRGDPTEVSHAVSLAKLFYHYKRAGFGIQIVKASKDQPTADLDIDGVSCDLKVRHDQTEQRMLCHHHLLQAGKYDEYSTIFWFNADSWGKFRH